MTVTQTAWQAKENHKTKQAQFYCRSCQLSCLHKAIYQLFICKYNGFKINTHKASDANKINQLVLKSLKVARHTVC